MIIFCYFKLNYYLPMKLKTGSVLKVAHEGVNHYFQVTAFTRLQEGVPEIKVVTKGRAFTLFKSSLFGWTQKNEPVKLNCSLLNRLGLVLDQCKLT